MRTAAVSYKPIGIIHSNHETLERIPIQPVYAANCTGYVEVFREFAEGLEDIDGFSHVYLIYHFHRAGSPKLIVKPFLDDVERGVFATRMPCRPNTIGLSIVEVAGRDGNRLIVNGVDVIDGTPLLDIKPYTARFDRVDTTRNGWYDSVDETVARKRGERRS